MSDLLYQADVLLEKFPGKGGWTYARIEAIAPNPQNPFGWVQVQGTIDSFALHRYKLMPMGNGQLFLPIRAEIRKKIKKEAGDFVHVVLYTDDSKGVFPDWIHHSLATDPDAERSFHILEVNQQQKYIDWVLAVKKEESQVERMAELLKKLAQK